MRSLTHTVPSLARRAQACLLGRADPQQDAFVGLEIRLRADTTGSGYRADLEVDDWREFPDLPVSLDLTALRSQAGDVNGYGLALGQALFADDACGAAYKETLAVARAANQGLRVRLVVEPAELQQVHWERLYHPYAETWQPLGSTAATPFSRHIAVRQWDRPAPIAHRPLRTLVVIASPKDLDTWGLDPIAADERLTLHGLMDGLGPIEPIYLESGSATPPTLNAIRRVLSEGVDLIHFLCHGADTPNGTVLYLEDEAGNVDPVTTDRLVDVVQLTATQPACCFLAACESAARSRFDALAPLGPALVDAGGVHAAVAMTDLVGLKTAQSFAAHFYTRLLTHGLVDVAVNEARALVQDEWDWAVPVLFMRVPDGRLLTARTPVWCRAARVALVALAVLAVAAAVGWPLAQPYLNPTQMSARFKIAVADFGVIDANGRVRSSPVSTALSQLVFDKLNDQYRENYAEFVDDDTRRVQIWHDSLGPEVKNVTFGVIRGATPEARADNARDLANRINADLVIYGNLVAEDDSTDLQMEFYNNSETWEGEPDAVTGRHVVGEPIALPPRYETEQMATLELLDRQVTLRTAALFWITVALTYDIIDRQQDALETLLHAKQELAGWQDADGQALLEYFIGREAFWVRDYDTAVNALTDSMQLKSDYANPRITLGATYYDMAQLFYTPQPIPDELAACFSPDHLADGAQSEDEAMQLTDRAIASVEEAIDIAPSSPWPPIESVAHLVQGHNYRLKGQIYLVAGDVDAAAPWFTDALTEFERAAEGFAARDQQQYAAWTHLGVGATYYLQALSHVVPVSTGAITDAGAQEDELAQSIDLFAQAAGEFQRCIDIGSEVFDLVFQAKVLDCGCTFYLSEVQKAQTQVETYLEGE